MKKLVALSLCLAGLMAVPVRPMFAASTPSDDDKDFLTKASQANINEIKLSELAEQKASSPQVKAFAKRMVMEHKRIGKSMEPFATDWGITPATDLDDDHKQAYQKLNGLSGNDFDKEYMDDMVTDHAKALDAFTSEAKDTKDAKFRAVVLRDKTMVAAHKNMAYDLKKKL